MKKLFAIMLLTSIFTMKAMENQVFIDPAQINFDNPAEIQNLIDNLNNYVKQAERFSTVIANGLDSLENAAAIPTWKPYFEYWQYKLLKRQKSLCAMELEFSELIQKFQVASIEKKKDHQLMSKGVFATALIRNFLNNLYFTLESLMNVEKEMDEIRRDVEKEKKIPWQASLWQSMLSNNVDRASQIMLGVIELSRQAKGLSELHNLQDRRSRSSSF